MMCFIDILLSMKHILFIIQAMIYHAENQNIKENILNMQRTTLGGYAQIHGSWIAMSLTLLSKSCIGRMIIVSRWVWMDIVFKLIQNPCS